MPHHLFIVCLLFCGAQEAMGSKEPNKKCSVYRPTFELTVGTVPAGTAFVVSDKNRLYAVSAQHLIGKAGGLSKDYTGHDMKAIFLSVELNPMQKGQPRLRSALWVNIPEARTMTHQSNTQDLFMAVLEKTQDNEIQAFSLAKSKPQVGDTVYLCAEVFGSEEWLHKARVEVSDDHELVYKFENKHIELQATSGAPVLNEGFQVVGVNLGGGDSIWGGVFGVANPAATIIKHLPK